MPQKHMEFDRFVSILDGLPEGMHRVSLQGEGEPLTHPRFWDMVALVQDRIHVPYTITNGSRLDPERIAEYFPSIGISLDTLDSEEAERIGRYKHAQMLENLERLLEQYEPPRVVIHTVDYGQDLKPVRDFVQSKGMRHVVQPLQTKDDYAYRYRDRVAPPTSTVSHCCRFIERRQTHFYNIAGVEMPCPFIKDTSSFVSADSIRDALARREVPMSCRGCHEIQAERATQ